MAEIDDTQLLSLNDFQEVSHFTEDKNIMVWEYGDEDPRKISGTNFIASLRQMFVEGVNAFLQVDYFSQSAPIVSDPSGGETWISYDGKFYVYDMSTSQWIFESLADENTVYIADAAQPLFVKRRYSVIFRNGTYILLSMVDLANSINDTATTSTTTTFSSKKLTELLADEKDPVFNAWLIDNAAYLQILLDDAPTNPSTKFLNGLRQWVDVAVVGGGGYQAPLYITNLPSFVAGYKQIAYERQEIGFQTDITLRNETVLVNTFLFEGQIDTTTIDSGNYIFASRAKIDSAGGNTRFRIAPFLRHANGSETVLFTFDCDEITYTSYQDVQKSFPSGTITCVETDRFGFRLYLVTASTSNKTVNLLAGDGYATFLVTPARLRHNQLRNPNGDLNFLHVNEEEKALIISTAGIVSEHTEAIEDLEDNKADTSHTHTKAEVGLANVDNTSDANKPISNATQTALNSKADKGTTLGDYEIADAYTQTEINTKLENIDHNNILNRNGNTGFLHITQEEKTNFVTASDFVEDFISNATGILYADLLDLIANDELTPSSSYRITNYTTTTAQADTTSAGHDFDIIVTALSTNKLSENAKCVRKVGDTYFENAKLEAWEIKYCIDNDTSRFAWADTINGKGVIYYMKDEWNNECPYDFKNIQFKYTDNLYYYTFSAFENTTEEINDASLMKYRAAYDDPKGMTNNNIKPAYTYLEAVDNWLTPQRLNNIIFKTYYDEDNYGIYLPSNNSFGVGCYDNFFNGTDYNGSNTFGNGCGSNTFGNSCRYNTFGKECHSNNWGNECYNNTFGKECHSNTFGNGCGSNTFGNGCGSNTFGDYCGYNTFGKECHSNTFGNTCGYNTFGNDCKYNNFYTDISGTTKKDFIRFIVLEDGCAYNNFYSTLTTSDNNYLQRIRIKGLENFAPTNIQITLSAVNTKYEWVICYTSGGTLKQYCPDD